MNIGGHSMLQHTTVDERPKTNPRHSSKAPFIQIGMCVRMSVCCIYGSEYW